MALTEKDKDFLEKLKAMMESKDLSVELRHDEPDYMVLRGAYGEKIHKTFRMTRQGVRWRFGHIFNRAYVEAFETILMVEKNFGVRLRDYAVRISRQRYAFRQSVQQSGFLAAHTIRPKAGGEEILASGDRR